MADPTFVDKVPLEPFDWGREQLQTENSTTAISMVRDRFDNTMETAELMLEKLVGPNGNSGYLGDLNNIILDYTPDPIGDFSVDVPLVSISVDNRPAPDLGDLTTVFPEFTEVPGAFLDIPALDTSSLTEIVVPDLGSTDIVFVEQVFASPLFDDLVTKLLADLNAAAESLDVTDPSFVDSSLPAPVADPTDMSVTPATFTPVEIPDDYNLDPDVEQAIYDRAVLRQDVIDDQQEQETLEFFSARGFDLPTGAMMGAIAELANERSRNRTDLNNKIIEVRADLALKNSQFTDELTQKDRHFNAEQSTKNEQFNSSLSVEKWKTYEDAVIRVGTLNAELEQRNNQFNSEQSVKNDQFKADLKVRIFQAVEDLKVKKKQFLYQAIKDLEVMLRDDFNKRMDRQLDLGKAIAANTIAAYAETIRGLLGKADIMKKYIEAQVENIRAIIETNVGNITLFSEKAKAYGIQIDAIAKKNEAVVDVFEAEVKGYDSETKAVIAKGELEIESYKLQVQNGELQLKKAISEVESKLNAFGIESSLREKVAEAMANIAMQTVASAYGAVNATAGISYGTGAHQNETYTHSESRSIGHSVGNSLNETHSFEEEV